MVAPSVAGAEEEMHLNWGVALSVLSSVLFVFFGVGQMAQAVRDGQPRRRLCGLSWVIGWLLNLVGVLLPLGTAHYAVRIAGLGFMCYALWVLFTLPKGESRNGPSA
jgi:xanthine/uracil/vitamin C permease (AzgA family)